MPVTRLGSMLKIPQLSRQLSLSTSSKAPLPTATVHVDSIFHTDGSETVPPPSYCVRVAGAHPTPATATACKPETVVEDEDRGAFKKVVWREVLTKVPKADGFVELEVRRQLDVCNPHPLEMELVGTVRLPETVGFQQFDVLREDGTSSGWTLRVEVPPVYEALSETAVLQIDRLFNAEKVDGATYFIRAGVRGQESRTTRLEPGVPNFASNEVQDCKWQQQLLSVPKSKEGVSLLVCRSDPQTGVRTIGRVMVAECTTNFETFPVTKDGKETGMYLRMHAPPVRPLVDMKGGKRTRYFVLPKLNRGTSHSRGTSSTASSEHDAFTAAQKAAAQAEQVKRVEGLYGHRFEGPTEPEAEAPPTRKTLRKTRPSRKSRKTDASAAAEWDEDGDWPEEDEVQDEEEVALERKRRIVMPEVAVGSPRAVFASASPWVRVGHRWTTRKSSPAEDDEAWPEEA